MGRNLAVGIIFLCVSSVMGQTPSEFENKYGKPVVSYLVSESILMTPEYTPDGKVCMMWLHPRHFAPGTTFISPIIPFQELKRVLNQLVPLQTRGAKKEPFDTGAAGGGADWMTYAYENVKFSFVSSFRPDPKTRQEYVFTIKPTDIPEKPEPKNSAPSDDDFSAIQLSRVEVATITWNGRPCGK